MDVETFLRDYTSQREDLQQRAREDLSYLPFQVAAIIKVNYNNDDNFQPGMWSKQMEETVMQWCGENCMHHFMSLRSTLYMAFADEEEAVMFKLLWG